LPSVDLALKSPAPGVHSPEHKMSRSRGYAVNFRIHGEKVMGITFPAAAVFQNENRFRDHGRKICFLN
jgi:hypothetical protein